MSPFTEDTLVQQTTAEYLHDKLKWDTEYVYNNETFGPERTFAPASEGMAAR